MTYDANNAYGPGAGDGSTAGAGYGPGAAYGPGAGFGADLDGATSPDDLSRPLYGASFGQAVRRFFKKYVVFAGRASRSEYWWATLFIGLLMLVPSILYTVGLTMISVQATTGAMSDPYGSQMSTTAPSGPGMTLSVIGGILLLIIWLATIIPSLSVTWRRLHDANFPGPFFFLGLIPGVGSIILIVLAILPSKPEGRRFDA